MKRVVTIAMAMALVLALSGCAASASSKSSATMSASDVSMASGAGSTATWTSVISAAEAAKGAGFSSFAMPDRTVIADIVFTNPSYSYITGVAQAKYDNGASLIIRKDDGSHSAQLTDSDVSKLTATWTKTYEGVEVTCHGVARGAATYITWKTNAGEYGVTLQSTDSKELAMDEEDIADIVRAIKATDGGAQSAPVATTPTTSASAASASSKASQGGLTIAESAAKAAAEGVSGGKAVSWYMNYVDGHGWVWVVTCVDANNNKMTYYVDNYGNPYNVDYDSNSSKQLTITEDAACAVAEQLSGGKTVSAYATTTTNHGMCWFVTTVDENGNVNSYYVDNNGGGFNADFD